METTRFYSFALGQEFDVTRPAGEVFVKGEVALIGNTRYEVKAVLGNDAMLYDIDRKYTLGWRPMHSLKKVA